MLEYGVLISSFSSPVLLYFSTHHYYVKEWQLRVRICLPYSPLVHRKSVRLSLRRTAANQRKLSAMLPEQNHNNSFPARGNLGPIDLTMLKLLLQFQSHDSTNIKGINL